MGFLDKFINGVNKVSDPFVGLTYFTDPSIARADRLASAGAAANGRIVGIRRELADTIEQQVYAIEVDGLDGPSRFGVQVGDAAQIRLRLGLPVLVRTDDKRAVLDLASMFGAWEVPGGDAIQRIRRKAPGDGIDDGALDARVQRRLKRWTPATAVIASIDPVTMLGMATENWDVRVTLADGTTSLSKKDQVPTYAAWWARPGAEVPVVVDPEDPSACAIDWPAVAAHAPPAAIDEDPPEGSIAALVEARRAAPPTGPSSMGVGEGATSTRDVIAANRNAAASQAALAAWVEAVKDGSMKPKTFHKSVDEWEAAGLCTPEEAAAARRAVG